MSDAPKRENVGGVIGVGLGLLLIPMLALSVLQSKARTVDGEALVRELFAGESLPYGLEVGEAAELPGGDRFVILEQPVVEEELLGTLEEKHPNQVVLVYYKSAESVNEAFSKRSESVWQGGGRRGRRGMGHGEDNGGGQATVIESGTLEWAEWRANYVHTRSKLWPEGDGEDSESDDEEGSAEGEEPETGELAQTEEPEVGPLKAELVPTRDMVRVNLSTESLFCVVYASWPKNVQATTDGMADLLRALRYSPPDPG